MPPGDDPAGTTLTSSGKDRRPASIPASIPTLTLAYGPDVSRLGECVHPGSRPMPINRVAAVFPGGALDDPEVSRTHAEVWRSPDDRFHVADLGSKNGTFVNGLRISKAGAPLSEGDVIRVGDSLLLFHMTQNPQPPDAAIEGIVGCGDGVRVLRRAIAAHAARSTTLLVLGETGTGKELVARGLASLGRPGRPFVALNVAAIPAGVVDATLFGHLRGAFTDARDARPGAFRSADGGTLFLDEVGELPRETQVKLLRVMEERAIVPVGASQPTPVDVRVVAATNRDLVKEVALGNFRGDLYARLAGTILEVPPLRQRIEDIPLLALHFTEGRRFSVDSMTALLRHPWPFNVRELRMVAQQAVAEADAGRPLELSPANRARLQTHRDLFQPAAPHERPCATTGDEAGPAHHLDRATIEDALSRANGNMTRAAASLGKDRGQFYRLVKRFRLDPDLYRKEDPCPDES